MEYLVDYSHDMKYVVIINKGRLNYSKAEQYSKEAIKLARRIDCNKFMIDQRETILNDGVNNLHIYGGELQQFGFRDSDRIAIILSNINMSIGKPEIMGNNSRWSEIRYYDSDKYDEAVNWLAENK